MMLAQAWRDTVVVKNRVQDSRFTDAWANAAQHFKTETLLGVISIVLAAPQRLEKNINFLNNIRSNDTESQFKLAGLS